MNLIVNEINCGLTEEENVTVNLWKNGQTIKIF